MPKLGMESIRRRELIKATLSVMHESGLSEPTLAAICARAGLSSSSIVNHYFNSKQELLECTMRELAAGFLGEVSLRVGTARTAVARVRAVIDANFAPSQCTPEAVSAWLWFWSRVPTNEAFAGIERATETRIVGELERALQAIVPAQDVADVAESVMALMYGFWLRFALDPKKIDVETARRITQDAVVSKLRVYGRVGAGTDLEASPAG
jgi:TetR/AcrR family transcriptional regulator, transcriptional repressor of bet genes